jgi:hypothetical protein
MINKIEQAFLTEGKNIYNFFQRPGIGYYIPLYQREYSWDKENIEQLLDDIGKGVENLLETDEEIRFLGTIITIVENNPNNIQPLDRRGLPASVRLVIDGQQRLSTIAMFACVMYQTIDELIAKLPTKTDIPICNELKEIADAWKEKLVEVFAFDLRNGEPRYKPKIIRQSLDTWVREGEIDKNYSSDIANYLAKFIQYTQDKEATGLPKYDRKNRVGKNLYQMHEWMMKTVCAAHLEKNDETFPSASELLQVNKKYNLQDYIWQYERSNLVQLIEEKNYEKPRSLSYLTASLTQTFAACHYLLERCCFTSIEPQNDKWAFDMFQSLNATGTPLTAIETFKPLVVNISNQKELLNGFKNSKNQVNFDKIEDLFKNKDSANKKNQLTNDFLASFAIVINGGKGMASHFSSQRKWLDDRFNELEPYLEQCRYIEYFGNYAQFYREYWEEYSGVNNMPLPRIASSSQSDLVSMLLLYLKDSNHKMTMTILGQFYIPILKNQENAVEIFMEACKTIAAFYTLWRSTYSNAGLDSVYRNFFKGVKEKDSENYIINPHTWKEQKGDLDLQELKNYLAQVLEEKEIASKETWIAKATTELNFDSKKICRFTLLLTSHETIPDSNAIGLMKKANTGTQKYLTIEKWNDTAIKTIEHIAPQKNAGDWDEKLYEDNKLYQSIGNLTLLHAPINTSMSNKGWKEKQLYFKHLSENDPDKLSTLAKEAENEGIVLASSTIALLQNVSYNAHISSIVAVTDWDAALVEKRTQRILEIVWDRISGWVLQRKKTNIII